MKQNTMLDPFELSQRTHSELPSKAHSPSTKPDFLPPQSSSFLPLEQLVHGRGVSAPLCTILLPLPAHSRLALRDCKLPCYSI